MLRQLLGLMVLFCPLMAQAANPIITDTFTADPAVLVVGDTVYLYAGHDQAGDKTHSYRMHEWLCYSSQDLQTWTSHGVPLKPTDFAWATDGAWASQVMEQAGKYYWFVTTRQKDGPMAIGVAVADTPAGPYKDYLGKPLVTGDMTPDHGNHGWEDIDPTVFTDANGVTYLFWGNRTCYYAKLSSDLKALDGPIQVVAIPEFEEAPWIHQRGDLYYLTYASGFPERTAYATSKSLEGPWTPHGLVSEGAGNSNTIHPAIIAFKDSWYFFYHTGMMQRPMMGGSHRRAVCVDRLEYNADGTMKMVVQTTAGVPPVK